MTGSGTLTGSSYALQGGTVSANLGTGTFTGLGSFSTAIANNDLVLTWASASAVPEPSTYAMIAGAAALGFAAWKRRKRSSVAG